MFGAGVCDCGTVTTVVCVCIDRHSSLSTRVCADYCVLNFPEMHL